MEGTGGSEDAGDRIDAYINEEEGANMEGYKEQNAPSTANFPSMMSPSKYHSESMTQSHKKERLRLGRKLARQWHEAELEQKRKLQQTHYEEDDED